MRVIIGLALVLGVLWGGYWGVGSTAVERGVAQWFRDQQGLTASHDGITVSGFPSRFDLTITAPKLADPVTGWGWSAPFVQVLSMTWKPWHVIAALPADQQVQGPGQGVHITSSRMAASLRLSPTTDLTLAEVIIEGQDVLAKSDRGWQVGVKSAVLALARDPANPLAQRLGVEVADLTPDPALTALVPELGATVSVVHLDASVLMSAPLDRHIAETRPGLTGVVVRDFRLDWGSLTITASGKVDRGPDGLAVGQIDLRIENWRQIPVLLVALEVILPDMGKTITRGMEVLAASGTDPAVLDLPLIMADGRMSLGPLPLGAAPRLN